MRRPITAPILATGFVIFDYDPIPTKLWQKAGKLLRQPPDAPKDLIYQENLLIPKMELARQLADKTVGARGFFKWESAPDEVW